MRSERQTIGHARAAVSKAERGEQDAKRSELVKGTTMKTDAECGCWCRSVRCDAMRGAATVEGLDAWV